MRYSDTKKCLEKRNKQIFENIKPDIWIFEWIKPKNVFFIVLINDEAYKIHLLLIYLFIYSQPSK